jgi:hypothetical protein
MVMVIRVLGFVFFKGCILPLNGRLEKLGLIPFALSLSKGEGSAVLVD